MKMKLDHILDTLTSKNSGGENRAVAYADFFNQLTNSDNLEEQLAGVAPKLVKIIRGDILNADDKTVLNALDVLCLCLGAGSLVRVEDEATLKSLLQCGQRTSSLDISRKTLDCLCAQRFEAPVLSSEISSVIDLLEAVSIKARTQSVSVLEKIVNVLVRLDEQLGQSLGATASRWGKLVFLGLINAAPDVRQKSLLLLKKFRVEICASAELSKHIIKAVNAGLAKSLKGLMSAHPQFVLQVWPLLVEVAGKELHKGSTINLLLEIVELGFKGPSDSRCQAFQAWRSLVDNFALDKNLIAEPKRIKLLLMVFKADNAKFEDVAIEKAVTWWHLCSRIGPKLTANFEVIVYPLLQFCVGNGTISSVTQMGQSPRLALKSSVSNLQVETQKNDMLQFPSVQKLGCEMIAQLVSRLEGAEDIKGIKRTIAPLPEEVLGSPTVFVKHAATIMAALQKLLLCVGKDLDGDLILHIWMSLTNHLRGALDSQVKTESRDVLSTYLTLLHLLVQQQILSAQTLMSMIKICCSFPQKVLASTAYNITGGQTVRACPAQLLTEELLSSHVLKNLSSADSFLQLFSAVTNAGASNLQGALLFLQNVAQVMDSSLLLIESPELLCRMWISLAQTLQHTITVTKEVNQGDALEYNFDCMYAVLLLPLRQNLPSKLSQAMYKNLFKTWKELYHSFASLSALVTTAEPNCCLEEICIKILATISAQSQEAVSIEFLSQVCSKMIECIDFSGLAVSQNQSKGLTMSPGKWMKRRQRPLGNLHSFIHLLTALQNRLNSILDDAESGGTFSQMAAGSVVLTAHTLVDIYSKLFSHITSTSLICHCLATLANPLARFFQPAAKTGTIKLLMPSFLVKLEKLWHEIAQCVINRYSGYYNAELLQSLSPLLEVTALHERKNIRKQTLVLWNTTFGSMATLDCPPSLKKRLLQMKEKNAIILPGVVSLEEAGVVAETPDIELGTGDSQLPVALLPPSMISPKPQKGSLLNLSPAKNMSPQLKVSPAKIVSPKEVQSLFGSRKKIDLDFLPKKDFVVIDSPKARKRQLLTEHQKEVLKQKSIIPALYSSVDTSQDTNLMSQFGTDTQQSLCSMDVVMSSEPQEVVKEDQKPVTCPKGTDSLSVAEIVVKAAELLQSQSELNSRRRSTRIQDLQSSCEAIVSLTELKTPKQSSCFSSESNNKKSHSIHEDMEVVGLKELNCTDVDNCGDKVSENMIKPLISKEEKSTVVDIHKDESDIAFNKTTTHITSQPVKSFSKNSVSGPSPRRISLRRVQSHGDMAPVGLNTNTEPSGSPADQKLPRRVPLRKIEQDKEEVEERTHEPCLAVTKDCSFICISDNAAQLSPVYSLATDDEEPKKNNLLLTLAEETQSPAKEFKSMEGVLCVPETPTRGESSTSPPLKLMSVRKLFADDDKDGSHRSITGEKDELTAECFVNTEAKSLKPMDCETMSSQGFAVLPEDIVSGGAELQEVEMPAVAEHAELDLVRISSEQTGSESLFPSGQMVISSLDMQMPTVCSTVVSQHKSSSSSNSLETSEELDKSSKTSSSSNSNFTCSQPTLVNETFPFSINKRKRAVPKRLCQVRKNMKKTSKVKISELQIKSLPISRKKNVNVSPRRKSNIGKMTFTTVTQNKSSPCSSSPSSPVTFTSIQSCRRPAGIASPKSAANQTVYNALDNLVTGSVTGSEVVFVSDDDIERSLQKKGEITPDMKSPISNPSRRHSAVKRLGRAQKRKLKSSQELNEIEDIKSSMNEIEDIKSSTPSSLNNKNKINETMLGKKEKMKPYMFKDLDENHFYSQPKKRRVKCNSFSDDDNMPLSSLVKDKQNDMDRLDIELSLDDDDDDNPLSSLIASNTSLKVEKLNPSKTIVIQSSDFIEKSVEDIQGVTEVVKRVTSFNSNDEVIIDLAHKKEGSMGDSFVLGTSVESSEVDLSSHNEGEKEHRRAVSNAEDLQHGQKSSSCHGIGSVSVSKPLDSPHPGNDYVTVYCDNSQPAHGSVSVPSESLWSGKDGEPMPSDHLLSGNDGELMPSDHHLLEKDGELMPSDHHLLEKDGELMPSDHLLLEKDGELMPSDHLLLEKDDELMPSDHLLSGKDGELMPSDHLLSGKDGESMQSDHLLSGKDGELMPSDLLLLEKDDELMPSDHLQSGKVHKSVPFNSLSTGNDSESIPCNSFQSGQNGNLIPSGSDQSGNSNASAPSKCLGSEGGSVLLPSDSLQSSNDHIQIPSNSLQSEKQVHITISELDNEIPQSASTASAIDIIKISHVGKPDLEKVSDKSVAINEITLEDQSATVIHSQIKCYMYRSEGMQGVDPISATTSQPVDEVSIDHQTEPRDKKEISKVCTAEMDSCSTDGPTQVPESPSQNKRSWVGDGSPERNCGQRESDGINNRSPSCSILKRFTDTPPSGKNRRVSFAEPVVSGESPVREHSRFWEPPSPAVTAAAAAMVNLSPRSNSPSRKGLVFRKTPGKMSMCKIKLDQPKQQDPVWPRVAKKSSSPQTQSSYKPTPESQLNSTDPVFPQLMDCRNPIDDILPQLTSSLWYRGLCQLMKGRNINTIGDISSLTEVQIDQLPVRHPKVENVKSILQSYMEQHGLVQAGHEQMPEAESFDSLICGPEDAEATGSSSQLVEARETAGSVSSGVTDGQPVALLQGLSNLVKQYSADQLKTLSTLELFEAHQSLNLLFTRLVEEMKSRHQNS